MYAHLRLMAVVWFVLSLLVGPTAAFAQAEGDASREHNIFLPFVQTANDSTVERPVEGLVEPYTFPVTPGTEAWQAFTTHEEMVMATQIPANVLDGMTTESLIETVLNYPLFSDTLAYNSIQQGFDAVATNFNGMPALVQRPDVGTKLLAKYRSLDPNTVVARASLEEQGAYDLQLTFVETLLAQDVILEKLSEPERRDLLNTAMSKFQSKQQQAEIYGHWGRERTALVMGRAISHVTSEGFLQAASTNAEFLSFIADGGFATEEVLSAIVSQAASYLEGAEIESTLVNSAAIEDYYAYVATPRGSRVSVTVMTYELTAAQIAAINASVALNYPRAIRETNASRLYNCHSFAWHSTATTNTAWMNNPGDDTYWLDGSYRYLGYAPGTGIPVGVPNNARVSYPSTSDHSAIKISATAFRSKWGQWPRMVHAPNYSPYNAAVLYYFYR
jgi:hypothetical protein